jgi:hypothetical protein
MYIKVCCWKKKLFHAITGLLKTKAAFSPSRKQSPRKFESNADCPVFYGLWWKRKTLSSPKTFAKQVFHRKTITQLFLKGCFAAQVCDPLALNQRLI